MHDDFAALFPVQHGSFAILGVVPKSHGFSVSVFRNGVRQFFFQIRRYLVLLLLWFVRFDPILSV